MNNIRIFEMSRIISNSSTRVLLESRRCSKSNDGIFKKNNGRHGEIKMEE